MSKLVRWAALALVTSASPSLSKAPCPKNKYDPPYPWFTGQGMAGDQYADVYIDIDKSGKPINCRMGQNNIPGDDKFYVCQAFLGQLTTTAPSANPTPGPPPANLPRNSPVKGTIYRRYVGYGPDHEKAERNARKQFFEQHPDERQECYPE